MILACGIAPVVILLWQRETKRETNQNDQMPIFHSQKRNTFTHTEKRIYQIRNFGENGTLSYYLFLAKYAHSHTYWAKPLPDRLINLDSG